MSSYDHQTRKCWTFIWMKTCINIISSNLNFFVSTRHVWLILRVRKLFPKQYDHFIVWSKNSKQTKILKTSDSDVAHDLSAKTVDRENTISRTLPAEMSIVCLSSSSFLIFSSSSCFILSIKASFSLCKQMKTYTLMKQHSLQC